MLPRTPCGQCRCVSASNDLSALTARCGITAKLPLEYLWAGTQGVLRAFRCEPRQVAGLTRCANEKIVAACGSSVHTMRLEWAVAGVLVLLPDKYSPAKLRVLRDFACKRRLDEILVPWRKQRHF